MLSTSLSHDYAIRNPEILLKLRYMALLNPIDFFANRILRFFNVFILFRDGNAIGDQLCMSAVIQALYEEHGLKTIIFSSYPEFFLNNPSVKKNFDLKRLPRFFVRILNFYIENSRSKYVGKFNFRKEGQSFVDYMRIRGSHQKLHLLEAHTLHFPLNLHLKDRTPKIFFSEDELELFSQQFLLPKDFILVHSATKETFTPNKSWSSTEMQKVVRILSELGQNVVQVGLANDPPLDHVYDLRGKTPNLRQLCYVVSKSKMTITTEGLLNHVAATFSVKTLLIQSGFSHIELAKYPSNTVLFYNPPQGCSPCWLTSPCPIQGKPCTEFITAEMVVSNTKKMIHI